MISKLVLFAGLVVGIGVIIEFLPPRKSVVQWGETSITIAHEYVEGAATMEIYGIFTSIKYHPLAQQPTASKVATSVKDGVLFVDLLPVPVTEKRLDLISAVSGTSGNSRFKYSQSLLVNGKLYSAIVVKQDGKEVRYSLAPVPETGLVRVASVTGDTANYAANVMNEDLRYGSPKLTANVFAIREKPSRSSRWKSITLNDDPTITKKALLEEFPELPTSALVTYQLLP